MIVLLHGEANQGIGEMIASTLREAFHGRIEIGETSASSPSAWPRDANWDDLLIVLFDDTPFPDAGSAYISKYKRDRGPSSLILPVALNSKHNRPPEAASEFKAFGLDSTLPSVDRKLVHRIGAMLGLNVQGRDHQIFISYRACDGTEIAKQLEEHLKSLGYPVWRDEAPDNDGETKILPGTMVQSQIDAALKWASIILLLDTPASPHSDWIKHEVDTANGLLLPILPLCFKSANDRKQGPRFRSLLELQRWVLLPFTEPPRIPAVADEDLHRIVEEMENFLCEMFQRRCRVPFVVEKEFVRHKFSWRILDNHLLMCESSKEQSSWITTKVLSHCSIFDQVHGPSIQKLSGFLRGIERPNHVLYIYDGGLIPEPQLKEIISSMSRGDNPVILHHQELAVLLDSDFQKVR